jgi:hypothetical protein
MVDLSRYISPVSSTDDATSAAERRLSELAGFLQRCVNGSSRSRVFSDTCQLQIENPWRAVLAEGTLESSSLGAVRLQNIFISHSSSDHVLRELEKVNDALVTMRSQVRDALTHGGLREDVADVLINYVDIKLTTEKTVAEIMADAERTLAARRDPAEALSAVQLASLLGVTDETVRNREAAGELFSILRPGRKRGREYPAFQAWEGVAGAPLKEVFAALGRPTGPVAYAFFTSPQETLGGLSPLEALLGLSPREVSPEAREFLRTGAPERLAVVVQAAQTYASSLEA